MQKKANTQAEVHSVIAERWSPRAFDAEKVVRQEQILSLLEAARWAPSCFGDEPWRFIVWNKNTDEAAWQNALDCIVPGNQTWAINAPVLILICANTQFSHNQKPNRWASYDTGAAAVSLCLQATSMGLATHQMGGFDSDKSRAEFNIPAQYELMSMMAVGFTLDPDDLPEDLKEREMADRKRKPLGELFFNGGWDKPII